MIQKGLTNRPKVNKKRSSVLRDMKINYQLYILILIPFIWLLIFRYIPMFGVQIAFRKFQAVKGILGSDWIGLYYFKKFFNDYMFSTVIKNTIVISFYQLVAGFPFPIILALAFNNTLRLKFKKAVQMITYMPHFISTVVMVGIIIQFLSPKVGIINHLIKFMGGTPTDFLAEASNFSSIYVWSGVWQSCGWGAIIYLAALAGIDAELHEAAVIDGANRFQRMLHIDLPGILPTITILLIMNAGNIMNVGFEKAFLLQNSLNLDASEIISTFTYKMGLASAGADFSYAAAIGLFNSVINLILIMIVNIIAKKTMETSLW
ncbi:MAG: carbohydrate transporter rane protein 1, family [Clostridiales bacterium]|jgi:ABC-type polysaccharide transport system permease subunit|nr:carbohydrate transporter rane protein 1, family [Clostridiales bacterium]